MKHLTYVLFFCAFLVSCSAPSSIITSKAEAEKRGIYHPPTRVVAKSTPVRKTTTTAVAQATPARKPVVKSTKASGPKAVLNEKEADDFDVSDENSSYIVRQLINTAESNLGAGYHTGGTNPDTGFDCSGLMFSTFRQFDITLPRSSNDMAKVGRKLDDNEIQKGDLIFFRTNGRSVINHVGMVTEVSGDEIKFIHSSTQKGVIISSTKEPYYERTFAQANRIIVNL